MTFDDSPERSGGLRASDAEREQVADALRRNHAEGRIGDDELDTRLEACYRARTLAELRRLLSDLPDGREGSTGGWLDGPGGWPGPGGRFGAGLGRPGGPGRELPWRPALIALAVLGALSVLGGWLWGGPYAGHHPHPPFILPLIAAFVVWRIVLRRRGMRSGR